MDEMVASDVPISYVVFVAMALEAPARWSVAEFVWLTVHG